jgi:hypothetical protein
MRAMMSFAAASASGLLASVYTLTSAHSSRALTDRAAAAAAPPQAQQGAWQRQRAFGWAARKLGRTRLLHALFASSSAAALSSSSTGMMLQDWGQLCSLAAEDSQPAPAAGRCCHPACSGSRGGGGAAAARFPGLVLGAARPLSGSRVQGPKPGGGGGGASADGRQGRDGRSPQHGCCCSCCGGGAAAVMAPRRTARSLSSSAALFDAAAAAAAATAAAAAAARGPRGCWLCCRCFLGNGCSSARLPGAAAPSACS